MIRQIPRNRARAICRLVDIAARYGPYRAKCLCRSLVSLKLMRASGLDGELVLGARIEDADFNAHAWVRLDGVVVNDRPDIDSRFQPFDSAG